MTAAEYRLKVIAAWRVAGIERSLRDRAEYRGRHHRKPTLTP